MEVFKTIKDLFRVLFFMIDRVVYGLIPILYKLIVSLANVDLYSNNKAIAALLNRVYIIVGIFMLFKLAFAILRYIVDPASFSDSAKGFTGLVKRVLIALILLVSVPFLFSKMYEYQGKILNSNIIPNLILGTGDNGADDFNEAAVDLQFMMYGPFFTLNTDASEFYACEPDPNDRPLSNVIGSTDMALKDGCLTAFATAMDEDETIKASGVTIDNFWKVDDEDEETRNFASLEPLLSLATSDGSYAINYIPIIPALCGGYLAFLLLSFCIDIASRAIKLMFLQIFSPIAIITSIDPTTSSQNDKLKDWGMEILKTYVSMFLRLIVIYVVIQLINIITSKLFAGVKGLYYEGFRDSADASLNIYIYIFLILGAFAVAKKIPELIEKAFGIKMSGEINMNPFKTFSENTGLQKIGALGAGLGVGIAGAATGAGAGRILAGAYNGLTGKNFSDVQRKMVDGNRAMRNAISDGSTFGGRMRARVTKFTGIQGALGKIEDSKVREENEIRQLEREKAERQNVVDGIEDSIRPVRDRINNNNNVISAIDKIKSRATNKAKESDEYRRRINAVESLRQRAEIETDQNKKMQLLRAASTAEARANRWVATTGAQEWLRQNPNDTEIYSAMREYESVAYNSGIQSFGTDQGVELWNQQDNLKRDNANSHSSIASQEEQIRLLKVSNDDTDRRINVHQEIIKDIDEMHRQEEANYKPVGAQSGGPKEPNLTGRADAGQHYGPGGNYGSVIPPIGGSSGGPGYGGPGGPGLGGPGGPGLGGPGGGPGSNP